MASLNAYSGYMRRSTRGVFFKEILELGTAKNYVLRYKDKVLALQNILDRSVNNKNTNKAKATNYSRPLVARNGTKAPLEKSKNSKVGPEGTNID